MDAQLTDPDLFDDLSDEDLEWVEEWRAAVRREDRRLPTHRPVIDVELPEPRSG